MGEKAGIITNHNLREDLRRVETYIAEHGQEAGTVSWQMAQDSFERIKREIGGLNKMTNETNTQRALIQRWQR